MKNGMQRPDVAGDSGTGDFVTSDLGTGSAARRCDWPECSEDGLYRAPRSPEALSDYHWFCLAHVRRYNAEWDYFAGRDAAEIDAYRRASAVGHRPTWRMGAGVTRLDLDAEDILDLMSMRPGIRNPFEPAERRAARRRATPRERRALEKLGLDESASVNDIKRRFKSLVKQHHPDSNGGRQDDSRLKDIIQAYSDLKECGRLQTEAARPENSGL